MMQLYPVLSRVASDGRKRIHLQNVPVFVYGTNRIIGALQALTI